jgi:multiple sugar transport system ATP-binding protein
MAQIVLDAVTKTYPDGFQAVKGVSLDIPDGQLCVLVGPSGCGKSTTLRMVAGLEDITGGSIAIGGRVVNDVHPKDRDIAMVFQSYALYPHMSVYDNMAFALKMRKLAKPEIDKRVRAAAETLGLTSMLQRKPGALSGGQRQRVAVGRAIVREPKAFLFDEPLSNLDAKLRVTTRTEIKSLQLRLKTTTIYVTHDQEEAMSLADLMVVMAGGVVQQKGPPMEIYRRPANRFVATFVGTPPMNILEGELRREGSQVVFVEGSSDQSGKACTLALSPRLAEKVGSHVGKPVALGVRPQSISAASHGSQGSQGSWRLPVGVVEAMGDHADVLLSTPKHGKIVARVPTTVEVVAGKALDVAIDGDAVHVFEAGEFGKNLTV